MKVALLFVVLSAVLATATGFVVPARRTASGNGVPSLTSMAMTVDAPPAATVSTVSGITAHSSSSYQLNSGVQSFLSSSSSSNVILANADDDAIAKIAAQSEKANAEARLKEAKRAKSSEQVANEKKGFAYWLWGGGFVAPFLATFYYFGFKFWEK